MYIVGYISVATIGVEGIVAFLCQSFYCFYIVALRNSTTRIEGIVVSLATL